MAESNSESTRCPCGYFGSAQTLGLCSKCFREREQNRDQMTADVARSSTSNVAMEMRIERENASYQEDHQCNNLTQRVETESSARVTDTEAARVISTAAVTSVSEASFSASVNTGSLPSLRGRKRKADELDGGEMEKDGQGQPEVIDPSDLRPVQQNKKRCFLCNCRMDLAIREIGKCKCDYVFCALHRLPEQHECTFDHKGHCRQEARAKMVVFKKHVGTALKRLDSDS